MFLRFVIALILGTVLGVERELVKKASGVRTEMLVAGGASLFAMIGLSLPYITASAIGVTPDPSTVNASLSVIANIVIGIGFLGAGLIIKTEDHPHNVTTAALVWLTAAIGVLVGIGLIELAVVCAIMIAVLLFLVRKLNISKELEGTTRKKK